MIRWGRRFPRALIVLATAVLVGASSPPSPIAITGASLIDGTGAGLRTGVTIVINGDRIAAIQPGRARVPAGAHILDGRGRYVIPGLWDMHVHLGDATERSLPLFLAAGVTGVRDMGSPSFVRLAHWREEIAHGERIGPLIFAPGPLLQAGPPVDTNHVEIRDAGQARHIVDSLANLHVDFIKVHEILTRDEYFAIADEARRRGLPYAGHLPVDHDTSLVTALEAARAGQRSLEHLAGIPYYVRTISHASLYDSLRQIGVFVDPTLQPVWVLAHLADSTLAEDPRLDRVSASRRAQWDDMRRTTRPDAMAFRVKLLGWRMDAVRDLLRAGVPLVAGTDLGVLPYLYPGSSLIEELERLVDCGLTPMEALQTATVNAARLLNRDRDMGTVEVGKRADLVVVDANPLADIRNLRQVHWVIANGRLYEPAELLSTVSREDNDHPPATPLRPDSTTRH
jgi:imidazolonepropionase-like amidohydrolase